jgi:hypothetical protein
MLTPFYVWIAPITVSQCVVPRSPAALGIQTSDAAQQRPRGGRPFGLRRPALYAARLSAILTLTWTSRAEPWHLDHGMVAGELALEARGVAGDQAAAAVITASPSRNGRGISGSGRRWCLHGR